MKTLELCIVQLTSADDLDQNIQTFLSVLKSAPADCDLICFPENSFFFRILKEDAMATVDLSESFWSEAKNWCQQRQAAIHIGATPVLKSGKVYNSSIFVTAEDVRCVYDKIHLFDVEVTGQASLKESDHFTHGSQPEMIQWKNWNLGLSVCYDLRFAELYNYYAQRDVDLILVPSAFLQKTGEAHWHTLLKARAIESQAYVAAAAQAGAHKSHQGDKNRVTYGHSLVVDPWGQVLVDLGAEDPKGFSLQSVSLQKSKIQDVRAQIPMKSHRRLWT